MVYHLVTYIKYFSLLPHDLTSNENISDIQITHTCLCNHNRQGLLLHDNKKMTLGDFKHRDITCN